MIELRNKVVDFFKESYRRDPLATYVEALETTLLITASATLTFTVLDPATHIFIPLYLIGSPQQCLAHGGVRVLPLFLCCWFTAMNTIALATLIWNAI